MKLLPIPLDGLNLYDVEFEYSNSQKEIKRKVGIDVKSLAYPFGYFNTEVKMIAKKYYDHAFTSVDSITQKNFSSDSYEILRLCIDKSHECKKKFLLDIYLNVRT